MSGDSRRARALNTARLHLPFVVLVLAYFAVGWAAARAIGRTDAVVLSMYSSLVYLMVALFLATFVFLHPLWVIFKVRPESPFRFIATHWRDRVLTPERLVGAAIVLLLLPSFVSVFSGLKMAIPFFQPFSWDPLFDLWDTRLHGGTRPWRLLQPLLGRPAITSFVSVLYQLWFFVTFSVLLWQAFSTARPRLRMQFLIAFVLTWALLGNLLATLLSSGGPVYFGRITGFDDPYAPLLAYLQQAAESYQVFVLQAQDLLWSTYSAQEETLGGGISAMPSMHVASTFLSVLVAWRTSRAFGIVMLLYLLAILIGSVHLAWHYALDGYVALPLTAALWWVAGRAARRIVPLADAPP